MFCQFWCSLQKPTMKWKIRTTIKPQKSTFSKRTKKSYTAWWHKSIRYICKVGFQCVHPFYNGTKKKNRLKTIHNHINVGWNIYLGMLVAFHCYYRCWLILLIVATNKKRLRKIKIVDEKTKKNEYKTETKQQQQW